MGKPEVAAEKAFQRLCELKQNAATGEGPTRLAEKRKIALAKAKQKELENLTVEDFFNETYFPQAKEDKRRRLAHQRINSSVSGYPPS